MKSANFLAYQTPQFALLSKDQLEEIHLAALEVLRCTGPGGHFLESETTLAHFRDYWFPNLLDRQRRERWLARGGKTLGQRLNERVRAIIAEHRPPALDPEIPRQLRAIMAGGA